jgi:hypothetical protein
LQAIAPHRFGGRTIMRILTRLLMAACLAVMIIAPANSYADLVSITPSSGDRGQTVYVSISGTSTHFEQGSNAVTTVWLAKETAAIYASSVYVGSITSLSAYIHIPADATLGLWDVFVNTTGYPNWSLINGFEVTRPVSDQVITNVDPDHAAPHQSLWVSISGDGTHFSQGSSAVTTVWFAQGSNTIYANSVNVYNTENLNAYFNIPDSAPLGFWDVSVSVTGYPLVTLTNGFTIELLCGDVDGNASVNLSDAIALLSYIFGLGPLQVPQAVADVDCNGRLNISDVVYLISYIFRNGAAPCAYCR